jgi:hypothetical protein
MADLGGALEYLGGLQDLVANFKAEDEGSADVPGAFFEQPATPPEPELSPSQVPGEPDEPSLPDDGVSTEDSDDEVQARLEDDWWKGWLKRYHELKKGGGKGSDKGSHKGSVSQCGSKAKAAAKVQIMPSSSEKSLEASRPWPWRNKQQKIGEPSPRPPFPPPFPPPAYLIGPVPPGFPPGMQAPPPPPGYVEPPPPSGYYASTRQPCLVPPPPPPAVLPSQKGDATTSSLWFRPTSKSKAMQNRPPGGARKNWEKQHRIVKAKSEQERLAFVERWPRPNCRNEDEIFWELFRASMPSDSASSMYKRCSLMLQEYSRLHGSVV